MTRLFSDNSGKLSGVICDSLGEFHDWMTSGPLPVIRHDPKFFPDPEKAITRLVTGDEKIVAESERVMGRIEAIEQLAQSLPMAERAVCGGMADVPAYLAGSPLAMRRRIRREDKRPLTIAVDVMVSASLRAGQIERRGIAALALLRKLQAEGYPVMLYFVAPGVVRGYSHKEAVVIAIDTAPMDLARAAWCLADRGMCRTLAFLAHTKLAGLQRYPDSNSWMPGSDIRAILDASGIDSSACLTVTGAHSRDNLGSDESAAQWVNAKYRKAIALAGQLPE